MAINFVYFVYSLVAIRLNSVQHARYTVFDWCKMQREKRDEIAYEVIIAYAVVLDLPLLRIVKEFCTLMKRKLIKICNYLCKSGNKMLVRAYISKKIYYTCIRLIEREGGRDCMCVFWWAFKLDAFYCVNSMQLNDLHILQNQKRRQT